MRKDIRHAAGVIIAGVLAGMLIIGSIAFAVMFNKLVERVIP